ILVMPDPVPATGCQVPGGQRPQMGSDLTQNLLPSRGDPQPGPGRPPGRAGHHERRLDRPQTTHRNHPAPSSPWPTRQPPPATVGPGSDRKPGNWPAPGTGGRTPTRSTRAAPALTQTPSKALEHTPGATVRNPAPPSSSQPVGQVPDLSRPQG